MSHSSYNSHSHKFGGFCGIFVGYLWISSIRAWKTLGTPGFAGAGPGCGSAQRHQRGPTRGVGQQREVSVAPFFSEGQLRRGKTPPNMGFNMVQHGLTWFNMV
jgi:hypothetical protein